MAIQRIKGHEDVGKTVELRSGSRPMTLVGVWDDGGMECHYDTPTGIAIITVPREALRFIADAATEEDS